MCSINNLITGYGVLSASSTYNLAIFMCGFSSLCMLIDSTWDVNTVYLLYPDTHLMLRTFFF